MKSIPFPLKPGEIDVQLRFTIRYAREMERFAGCNYHTLFARGQQVDAVCLMTCYALKHDDPKMTVDKAVDLVSAYVDGGGNIVTLYEALEEAMKHSGCYAPVPKDEEKGGAEGDPPTESASATT